VIVAGSKTSSPLNPLGSYVQFSLAQRQHSPIRPTRGLPRNEDRKIRKLAIRRDVIADLKRPKSNVESGNRVGVFFRAFLRKLISCSARRQTDSQKAAKHKDSGAHGSQRRFVRQH
jgi:hypothetical protein